VQPIPGVSAVQGIPGLAARCGGTYDQDGPVEESKQQTIVDGYVQQVMDLEDGIELVEAVHSGKGRIQIFIWRPEGVTIEDCTRINRRLARELEHDEFVQGSMSIEVSSPGLDRRLKSRRDFERVVGEQLKLEVEEEEGGIRTITGLLTEVADDDLLLEPPVKKKKGGPDNPGAPIRVQLNRIREGKIEIIL